MEWILHHHFFLPSPFYSKDVFCLLRSSFISYLLVRFEFTLVHSWFFLIQTLCTHNLSFFSVSPDPLLKKDNTSTCIYTKTRNITAIVIQLNCLLTQQIQIITRRQCRLSCFRWPHLITVVHPQIILRPGILGAFPCIKFSGIFLQSIFDQKLLVCRNTILS